MIIFDRHANFKYKCGSRQFLCKKYYVDTVGRNKKVIQEHIKNQIQEDIAYEQMSLKEYIYQSIASLDYRGSITTFNCLN